MKSLRFLSYAITVRVLGLRIAQKSDDGGKILRRMALTGE